MEHVMFSDTALGETELQAIFEHSHDGIYIVDAENERIMDVNPRACEMLGYDRDELVGGSPELVHPNEMNSLRTFFTEVIEQAHATSDDLTCTSCEGSLLEVEISASLVQTGDRQLVVAMVRDVTQRKEAERKLEQIASLPRENPGPVVELDLSGNIVYTNPAARREFPLIDQLGTMHPFCAGVTSIVNRLLSENRRIADFEVEIGSATYAQKIALSPETNLVRLYATDMTSRKRAAQLEQELAVSSAIKSATLDTIIRLSRAAEYRDEDTGSHITRIAQYSQALARALGMAESECEFLLHAAPMHDIGKIAIPDRVLLKPGKLTEDEMSLMKQHTTYGAQLLNGAESELMQVAEKIAYTHHEKWNGTGYPQGTSGDRIDIHGRIVAVVDVYDALRSRRPYKEPMPYEKTIGILREERGSHFDPEILDAFLDIQGQIRDIESSYNEDSDLFDASEPLRS